MTFQPEDARGHRRIDAGLYPPCRFITAAMDLAMVSPAERYRELITLWSSAQLLCEETMLSVRRFATAKQARLFNDDQAMGLATIRPLAAPWCACAP
jgi:hypothetical protein